LLVFYLDDIHALSSSNKIARRSFLSQAITTSLIAAGSCLSPNLATALNTEVFQYSDTWTGTDLKLLSLPESAQHSQWDMARWPDPILRRPASPVEAQWYGTDALQRACQLLQQTARREQAVGLAAQQCGINARIVYIEQPRPLSLINPHIVKRSPEMDMKVWQEQCLVLPPNFTATVLRDAWVEVQYWNVQGTMQTIRLQGEASRCVQHEMGTYEWTLFGEANFGWERDYTKLITNTLLFLCRSRPWNFDLGSYWTGRNGK
jgi:peptide deformylase